MEKKERGITLIALVLTIIVMLILVAVSINVAVNGGLFKKAGEAVKKTEIAKLMEDWMVERWGNHTSEADEDLNGRLSEYFDNKYPQFEDQFMIGNGKVVYIGTNPEVRQSFEDLGATEEQTNYDYWHENPTNHDEIICSNYTTKKFIKGDVVPNYENGDETSWMVLGEDKKNPNNILITTSGQTTAENAKMNTASIKYGTVKQQLDDKCKELYGSNARSMTMEDIDNFLDFHNASKGLYFNNDGNFQALGENGPKNLKELANPNNQLWQAIASSVFYTPDDPGKTFNHVVALANPDTKAKSEKILEGYDLDMWGYRYNATEGAVDLVDGTKKMGDSTNKVAKAKKIYGPDENNYYSYLLASRGVIPYASNGYARFYVGGVCNGNARSAYWNLFNSSNYVVISISVGLRPVVSIPASEIQPANQS